MNLYDILYNMATMTQTNFKKRCFENPAKNKMSANYSVQLKYETNKVSNTNHQFFAEEIELAVKATLMFLQMKEYHLGVCMYFAYKEKHITQQ